MQGFSQVSNTWVLFRLVGSLGGSAQGTTSTQRDFDFTKPQQ
jgi:hypothetical protein